MLVIMINNYACTNLLMEPLISDCRNLLQGFSNPIVKHIFRKANQCVDALANLGALSVIPFITFANPPYVVENLLAFDKAELFCNIIVSL
jgi:hypothetical protein